MKKLLIMGSIFLWLFAACTDDPFESENRTIGNETLVSLDLQVPGIQVAETRELDKDKEEEIKTADVLVFDNSGNYKYRKAASVTGTNNAYKINVYLRKSLNERKLVILTNLQSEIIKLDPNQEDDKFGTGAATKKTKDEILKLIRFDTGKWKTDGADYRRLPMWGETKKAKKIDANTIFDEIKLLRAVARIDVICEGQSLATFKLQTVTVYNSNSQGYAAPLPNKWSDEAGKRNPSVDGLTLNKTNPTYTATDGKGLIHEIYTSEYDNKTKTVNHFCLVVGGKYDKDTKTTYYRVDFVKGKDILNILRNYHYQINITKVNGRGYDDEKTAYESGPINMESTVIGWNSGDLSEVHYDGKFMLGLDPTSFELSKEEHKGVKLKVVATHPNKWNYRISDKIDLNAEVKDNNDISWIKNIHKDVANQDGSLTFELLANGSAKDRTAYIHIKSGNLVATVKVKQTNLQGVSVFVTDGNNDPVSELVFPSGKNGSQSITTQTLNVQ